MSCLRGLTVIGDTWDEMQLALQLSPFVHTVTLLVQQVQLLRCATGTVITPGTARTRV